MTPLNQSIEDLIERLVVFEKSVAKLKTASVSGSVLRKEAKTLYKDWLLVLGQVEQGVGIDPGKLTALSESWTRLRSLANGKNPKTAYRKSLKVLISELESDVLHPLIKKAGLKTLGGTAKTVLANVSDTQITAYLDEAVICAQHDCLRAAVILFWCAAASRIQTKLLTLGLSVLESEFDKMRLDQGILFRSFNRVYKMTSNPDIQEIADAHLVLLCRFLGWIDDSQFKQLKGCLDLRNASGHPGGYRPDAVKLQVYLADLVQLVLANPRFA
jgi:hypothetical protein